MKKVALVFVVAVFVPSLVLAWLAVRSLRDQQTVLERQQALLFQNVTDSVAREINDYLAAQQRQFDELVETLVTNSVPREAAAGFDDHLRAVWPAAEVGFCVTLSGNLLCPSPTTRPETRIFCVDNGSFLGNQEIAEVYRNSLNNNAGLNNFVPQSVTLQSESSPSQTINFNNQTASDPGNNAVAPTNFVNYNKAQNRKVNPVQQNLQMGNQKEAPSQDQNLSKVVPSEAQFRQLIGEEPSGMLARFLQDKLRLLFWHRLERDPQLVFGAQLDLQRVTLQLRMMLAGKAQLATGYDPRESVNRLSSSWGANSPSPALPDGLSLFVLDDNAKPLASSDSWFGSELTGAGGRALIIPHNSNPFDAAFRERFHTDLKHPFAATEIGEALPHWEVAAYRSNPEQIKQAARTIQFTLGLLIVVLVAAIGIGSWLIVRDLNRQLTLARQKTDFVSNVSHELKTPLTSIRMFAELLAEGRVNEPAKQRGYLNIITAEAARLTRLINNVLDFARLERGEKKYNFAECDLTALARESAETFRPHLEAGGFNFETRLLDSPLLVRADRDAVAQVIVNLLSNAEKYSNGTKEVRLELSSNGASFTELRVLDRGPGVPRGCEEKIFEQFFRVNDSLTNAIPGTGLGLTLARQIARAHGGDVSYAAREGGGSCFTLRLPTGKSATTNEHA